MARGGWVGSDVWDKVPNKTVFFLGPSLTICDIFKPVGTALWLVPAAGRAA